MTKFNNPDAVGATYGVDPALPTGYALNTSTGVITATVASAAAGVFSTRAFDLTKVDGRSATALLTVGMTPTFPPGTPTYGSDLATGTHVLSNATFTAGNGDSEPVRWRKNNGGTQGHSLVSMSVTAGTQYVVDGILEVDSAYGDVPSGAAVRFEVRTAAFGTNYCYAGIDAPTAGTQYNIATTTPDFLLGTATSEFISGVGVVFTAVATETVVLKAVIDSTGTDDRPGLYVRDFRLRQYTPGAPARDTGTISYDAIPSVTAEASEALSFDILANFTNADELLPATTLPLGAVLDNGVLEWTPGIAGTYEFDVTPRNGDGAGTNLSFTVSVVEDFEPPPFWTTEPTISPDPALGAIEAGDAVQIASGTPGNVGWTAAITGTGAPADFDTNVTVSEGSYSWTVTLSRPDSPTTLETLLTFTVQAAAGGGSGTPETILDGATVSDNGDENIRVTLSAPLPAGYVPTCRVWNDGDTEPAFAPAAMAEGASRAIWSGARTFQHGGATGRMIRVWVRDSAGDLVDEASFGPVTIADIPAPAVVAAISAQEVASGGSVSIDVSGVFDTGTTGLTVSGLPSGASYSAGTISASAGAVADGLYAITLTASNEIAHNGAGGETTSVVSLRLGEAEVGEVAPANALLSDRSLFGIPSGTILRSWTQIETLYPGVTVVENGGELRITGANDTMIERIDFTGKQVNPNPGSTTPVAGFRDCKFEVGNFVQGPLLWMRCRLVTHCDFRGNWGPTSATKVQAVKSPDFAASSDQNDRRLGGFFGTIENCLMFGLSDDPIKGGPRAGQDAPAIIRNNWINTTNLISDPAGDPHADIVNFYGSGVDSIIEGNVFWLGQYREPPHADLTYPAEAPTYWQAVNNVLRCVANTGNYGFDRSGVVYFRNNYVHRDTDIQDQQSFLFDVIRGDSRNAFWDVRVTDNVLGRDPSQPDTTYDNLLRASENVTVWSGNVRMNGAAATASI